MDTDQRARYGDALVELLGGKERKVMPEEIAEAAPDVRMRAALLAVVG